VGSWRRLPAQLEVIRDTDADIWVLTETRASLPLNGSHPYVVHAPSHPARRPDLDERWTSIWSRYPLSDAAIKPSPRGTVAAFASTPAGEIVIYGTVVPWSHERGDDGEAAVWSEHEHELERQAGEWRALASRFPAVVAGDFNQSFHTPGYGTTRLRARHLALYEQAGLVCVTRDQVVDAQPMVDHVLLSRRLAVDSSIAATWGRRSVRGVRLSDHSGVAVDVVLS
jgi:endonuclease/exonuclease/phosphatase family metal-dependent hydrolase